MALAVLASLILVVAQSSWWASTFAGEVEGAYLANILWTVFNNVVMLTFIFVAWPRAYK